LESRDLIGRGGAAANKYHGCGRLQTNNDFAPIEIMCSVPAAYRACGPNSHPLKACLHFAGRPHTAGTICTQIAFLHFSSFLHIVDRAERAGNRADLASDARRSMRDLRTPDKPPAPCIVALRAGMWGLAAGFVKIENPGAGFGRTRKSPTTRSTQNRSAGICAVKRAAKTPGAQITSVARTDRATVGT
jgi:hypothetical protein